MVQGLSFIRLIISVFNILTINRLAVSALGCSIGNCRAAMDVRQVTE